MSSISDRYQKVAAGFTARAESVPDERWSQPSPCDGWDARAVVDHMVSAHNMFLGFVGKAFEPSESAANDPVAAWTEARDAMLAALEDPETARTEYDSPFGHSVFEESADRFVTNDVLVHTWDLARAIGGDERLDADEVGVALTAFESIGDSVRSPRVFGPEIPLADDASEQDRLLGFTGRDPRV
jgi:uncharacterized protein (TIGR03086 family)